ncbi:class I SAM-dependent methyltransferase, partial [Patescibacteria group bacterium]|nr:class I SAM-dependent methyltransferase [Patescibacteria group bacterium]MBU4098891.1 class I SAM-dependent methyltransferase [Patescibacteria group bacterium]
MQAISRAIIECRSCKSKTLSNVFSLGKSYLSDFVKNNIKPPRYPLSLIMCKNCYLLQLKHTTPASLLYTDHYGYKSGINQTMNDELKDIVNKTLDKFEGTEGKLRVVDIGANDGTLLKNYPKSFERIGVEPIKKLAKECKKHADIVINDFFNYEAFEEKAGTKKANIITVISCFYDMEDPNTFVSDITKILNENGILVIQQNYLVKMLTQNAFDNIVHEHLEYYSLLSLQNLLIRHNLEVFDLELRELNGGSFRTYIGCKSKRPISTRVYEQMELEKIIGLQRKKIYTDFAKRIRQNKKELYTFIRKGADAGKKIYVYGASTRGNTLLQYFD